jgi:phage gp36-like protein
MYCTIENIIADISEATLIELTSDAVAPAEKETNEALVTSKIEEVSRMIDTYLTSRYPIPVVNTDDLLRLRPIAVSLVVCELYQRRIGLDYSESLQARRRDATAQLEKIQKGVIVLSAGTPDTRPSFYRTNKRTRIFTDETFLGY